jgi:dethiobiotin synthase
MSRTAPPTYLLVTGTSTGVGKTIATAAMAVALRNCGLRVGVVKPVQTGVDTDEPSDAAVVQRLAGLEHVRELTRLPDPLAPDTAARLRGIAIPSVAELARDLVAGSAGFDVVLVEGAGGVLVRLDTDGRTLLDLGAALAHTTHAVSAVVVTTLTLGTLNHTELTVRALDSAGLAVTGLVIGSKSDDLGLAETCNRTELPRVTGLPVLAELPAGAGHLSPADFQAAAPAWFAGLRAAILPGQR